jgi:DNA mismatch endonuclease, patch repair protein
MDRFSPSRRDTQPEMKVRKAAHALGLRFRLHRKELPGSPDIVFPRRKLVVFVHGCFWHQHPGCKRATIPQSRQEFWPAKLNRNVERDSAVVSALKEAGWRVEIIWECETKVDAVLGQRLKDITRSGHPTIPGLWERTAKGPL